MDSEERDQQAQEYRRLYDYIIQTGQKPVGAPFDNRLQQARVHYFPWEYSTYTANGSTSAESAE